MAREGWALVIDKTSRRDWTEFSLVSPQNRDSIGRAARVLDELGSKSSALIFDELGESGAFPPVVNRALRCITDSTSGSRDLAAILNEDQIVAGRLVGMANSVYYRGKARFTTVREAIVRIGYRQVRELLLATACSMAYHRSKTSFYTTGDGLWLHSLATAVAAETVASITNLDELDNSYLAGLLHDIGRLVVPKALLGTQLQTLDKMVKEEHCSFQQAEFQMLGFTHAEVGALLLDHWKSDDRLIASVGSHHDYAAEAGPLAWIVHVADVLAVMAGYPEHQLGWDYSFDQTVAECIDLPKWLPKHSSGAEIRLLQEIRQGVLEACNLLGL